MCWMAMRPRSHSEPYFHLSRGAVDSKIYSENCIKCLIPFIKRYYPNNDFMFWPDRASAHYSKATLQTFKSLEIPVVPKDKIAPN